MTSVQEWAIAVGVGIFIVFLLLFAWSSYNRRRLQRKHPIEPGDLRELEGRLLDHIKRESGDRREAIPLAPFWHREAHPQGGDGKTFGRRVPNIIREQAISDLRKKKHIKLPDSAPRQVSSNKEQDAFEEFLQTVGELLSEMGTTAWQIFKDGLAIPPTAVRLSDGTFDRMNHGATGQTIIGGIVQNQNNHGTFIGSPPIQAGGSAHVSTSNISADVKGDPFAPDALDQMVDIFRREADAAPEPTRSQMREVAAGVEREAGQETVDRDAVVSRMQRAKRIIAGAGGVFAASSEALKAWFDLQSSV